MLQMFVTPFFSKVTVNFKFDKFQTKVLSLQKYVYCLFGINIFLFLVVHVLIGVVLNGMVEISVLSKDELLTPNIEGVVAL